MPERGQVPVHVRDGGSPDTAAKVVKSTHCACRERLSSLREVPLVLSETSQVSSLPQWGHPALCAVKHPGLCREALLQVCFQDPQKTPDLATHHPVSHRPLLSYWHGTISQL